MKMNFLHRRMVDGSLRFCQEFEHTRRVRLHTVRKWTLADHRCDIAEMPAPAGMIRSKNVDMNCGDAIPDDVLPRKLDIRERNVPDVLLKNIERHCGAYKSR